MTLNKGSVFALQNAIMLVSKNGSGSTRYDLCSHIRHIVGKDGKQDGEGVWHDAIGSVHPFKQIYPALSSFGNLRLYAYIENQEEIYTFCRLFRTLLKSKHVTLVHVRKGKKPVPDTWLRACRMLKCASITFPERASTSIRATQKLIEGTKAVTDTFEVMRECLKVLEKVHVVKPEISRKKMTRFANLLLSAAMDHSEKRIVKYKPQFIQAAEAIIVEWAEQRRKEIQSKVQALEKEELEMWTVVNTAKTKDSVELSLTQKQDLGTSN